MDTKRIGKKPAFTTNVEFGYWLAKRAETVVCGRPDSAKKIKYLDWLYKKESDEKIFNTLEETINKALELINKI